MGEFKKLIGFHFQVFLKMKYGRLELTQVFVEDLTPRVKYLICHKRKRTFLQNCVCRFTHSKRINNVDHTFFDEVCFYKLFNSYEIRPTSKINISLYHFTSASYEFYEINPQRHKIQLQMEQRAILLILKKITGDMYMFYSIY